MYVRMNRISRHRCGHLYTQKYRTVNIVYIEYEVVTHSHSLTHISADQPTSVLIYSALFQLLPLNIRMIVVLLKHDVEYAAFIKLPIFNA